MGNARCQSQHASLSHVNTIQANQVDWVLFTCTLKQTPFLFKAGKTLSEAEIILFRYMLDDRWLAEYFCSFNARNSKCLTCNMQKVFTQILRVPNNPISLLQTLLHDKNIKKGLIILVAKYSECPKRKVFLIFYIPPL